MYMLVKPESMPCEDIDVQHRDSTLITCNMVEYEAWLKSTAVVLGLASCCITTALNFPQSTQIPTSLAAYTDEMHKQLLLVLGNTIDTLGIS